MYIYLKVTNAKKGSFFYALCLITQISCTPQTKMVLPEILPEPTRSAVTKEITKQPKIIGGKPVHIKKLQPLHLTRANLDKTADSPSFALPVEKLTLNANALPLKDFIHLALNEVLQIPIEIDTAVAKRTDEVNLHITKPLHAEKLLEIIEQILDSYDVSLARVKHGLKVLPKAALKNQPPMMGQLNKVGYGQVIEVIPLQYVSMAELQAISAPIFQVGKYGRINYNKRLNAIIAVGEADRVERFRNFVAFLDHPGFNQHQLRLVRPIYWQAEELAKQLINLLKTQGIPVSDNADDNSKVVVLSVESMNALLITSPQETWMQQAETFIKQLDDVDAAGPRRRTFIYFTQHRPADELGELIAKATGNNSSVASSKDASQREHSQKQNNNGKTEPKISERNTPSSEANTEHPTANLNIVVDSKRSALIFMGTADAYEMIVPILKTLDIPARQVLIEITVADISLDSSTQAGIEWKIDKLNIGGAVGSLGTLGGLGLVSGGLTYQLIHQASGVQALLTALATEGKAKILSNPTLLAMDGENAHLQVGTQISVVSSEVSNSASSNSNDVGLLRSFTYIDTGVILDIKPTITEHGSIRMEIKQEVSEPGPSSGAQPPIFKRLVDTVLVANSGQTILIGGLITHNQSNSETKVPLLGDIPYLGALFRKISTTDHSTELIMLITPHIIKDQNDADDLTRSYRSRIGW